MNVQINSKDTSGKIKKKSTFKNKGSNNQEEKIILNNNINSNLEKHQKDQIKIKMQKGKTNTKVIDSPFINDEKILNEKDKEIISIFKNYKSHLVNNSNNNLNGGFQVKNSIDNMNKEDKKNKIIDIDKNKEELLRNFTNQIKLSGIIKKNNE